MALDVMNEGFGERKVCIFIRRVTFLGYFLDVDVIIVYFKFSIRIDFLKGVCTIGYIAQEHLLVNTCGCSRMFGLYHRSIVYGT